MQRGLEPSVRTVHDVVEKVLSRTSGRLTLPRGECVWSETDRLVVGRWVSPPARPELVLARSGGTRSLEWGIVFEAEELTPGGGFGRSRWEAVLDAGAASGPLKIRPWSAGDRFHPLGAPGSKKLQDFFVDSRVARRSRPEVPILWSGERIAWVVGHRIDERFKVTRSSSKVLRVRATPVEAKV